MTKKMRCIYRRGRRKNSRSGINYINETFWLEIWKMLEEEQHVLLRGLQRKLCTQPNFS